MGMSKEEFMNRYKIDMEVRKKQQMERARKSYMDAVAVELRRDKRIKSMGI